MNNANKIDEFLTFDNLKTLGGSSTAVWISSGVIGYIFAKCDPYPDWLKLVALILSVLISIGITVSRKKKMVKYYLLAFLNGFLIFSTATGYNTIHNEFSKSQGCNDSSGGKSLKSIQNDVYYSSIISFLDKPWFLPKTLVDEKETLVKEKEKILLERDSVMDVNKKLKEELSRLPKNERDFKDKLDSLNKLQKGFLEDYNNLKKDSEKLNNDLKKAKNENEDYRNKLTKLQTGYNSLQEKYSNLAKECSGYAQLKKDYEKLQRDCEQLRKETEALKSGSEYEKISLQLQDCNKRLKECLSKRDTIK